MRAVTSREIGINDRRDAARSPRPGAAAACCWSTTARSSYERIAGDARRRAHRRCRSRTRSEALFHAAEGNYDLLIVSLGAGEFRRAAAVQPGPLARPHPQRADPGDRRGRRQRAAAARARDRRERLSGAADRQERAAGARAHADPQASATPSGCATMCSMSIEMAITDALTGLYNRRYMESHLSTLVEQAAARGKPLTAAGARHRLLQGDQRHPRPRRRRRRAARIRRAGASKSIRGIDLACRYGGEEFVIVMPETDMAVATMVAERLRRRIAGEPFAIQQGAKRDRGDDLDRDRGARRRRRHRRARSSSAPTRRSIAPSATAAIAWWPTRRDGLARVPAGHTSSPALDPIFAATFCARLRAARASTITI